MNLLVSDSKFFLGGRWCYNRGIATAAFVSGFVRQTRIPQLASRDAGFVLFMLPPFRGKGPR